VSTPKKLTLLAVGLCGPATIIVSVSLGCLDTSPALAQSPAPQQGPAGQVKAPAEALRPCTVEVSWEGRPGWLMPDLFLDIAVVVEDADANPRAELLVRRVKILAVDQKDGWSARVTVETSAAQARRLIAAQRQGRLIPFLCSPVEPPPEERSITVKDLLPTRRKP
jgi:hypothetical protein